MTREIGRPADEETERGSASGYQKRNPGRLSNDSEKSPAVKSYQEISNKLDLVGSEKNFISISDFVP